MILYIVYQYFDLLLLLPSIHIYALSEFVNCLDFFPQDYFNQHQWGSTNYKNCLFPFPNDRPNLQNRIMIILFSLRGLSLDYSGSY